jgi:hypothetical protein
LVDEVRRVYYATVLPHCVVAAAMLGYLALAPAEFQDGQCRRRATILKLGVNPTSTTISPRASALPPGPALVAAGPLRRRPFGLLDECQRRYGAAVTLCIAGNGRFVMLSDPEAVREVFRGDPDVLDQAASLPNFPKFASSPLAPRIVPVIIGLPQEFVP